MKGHPHGKHLGHERCKACLGGSEKGRTFQKVRRDPDDQLVTTSVRVLQSQRKWADEQPGGWSTEVRRLLKEAMTREKISKSKTRKI